MVEIELEKTYLVKEIPVGVSKCEFKEILDIYIPESYPHPVLRIRKKGDKFEITKKTPVNDKDSSEQHEHTIPLTREEFEVLEKSPGKRLRKYRYYYKYDGLVSEVDVFKDELEGLVLVDFEFKSVKDKDTFKIPDFCLAEVTQDATIAGGILAGKKYSDIETVLKKYGYKKIDKI